MKTCRGGKISMILLFTLVVIVTLSGNLWATQQYILYNLDSTTKVNIGGDAAYGINIFGQVVGGIQGGSGPGQAWIWDWNTKVKTPLTNPLGYNYSIASGINDSGVITGTFSVDGGAVYNNTAFSYNIKTEAVQLLSTTSGDSSYGYAINNSGQIVGTSYVYDTGSWEISKIKAFKYGETMQDLGNLPDYVDSDGNNHPRDSSEAYAINNSGQAAGYSGGVQCYPQGVLFSNGVYDLGNLAGVTDPRDSNIYTMARGMNDNGAIVGHSAGRAFLWTASGGIRDLNISSISDSVAYDINNLGQIVGKEGGYAYTGGNAFIWTEDGGMQYLSDLVVNKDALVAFGGYLEAATAINENGWIVGYGPHAFLLVPTPLPGSLLLLGTGLLGLGAVGWRRRRG